MGLSHPWWIAAGLIAGCLCAALAWGSGRRSFGAAVAAAVALGLLALGLAGPWHEVAHPGNRLAVFAVDCSDSIPDGERARAAAYIRAAWAETAPARRAVIAFGADAHVVVAPGQPLPADLEGRLAEAPIGRHRSLLDPVLAMAATLRHGDEPAHCVCFTDGALVRDSPQAAPIPVSVIPLASVGDTEPNLVACEALEGPDVAEAGAPVTLALRYRAARALRAELVLADGASGTEVLTRDRVTLRAGGPHLVALPALLLAAGPHVLTVTVRLETPDPRREDNRAALALEVLDPPPVLLVSDAPEAAGALVLRRALAAQAIPAKTVGPDEVVAGMLDDVRVVIWETPATLAAQQEPGSMIAQWVRRGGGLIVAAGPQELHPTDGLGGVLPARVPRIPPPPDPEPETEPDPEPPPDDPTPDPPKPKELEFVPVGLILIIDKSGSMQGPKIRLAREAAIAALEMLDEKDKLGVLAVDQESRWVLDPASTLTRPEAIDRISRLVAGGGTNLYPALIKARDAVRQLPVGARHVVLLTDGHDENVREFQTLAEGMRGRGITISTIGIGDQFDSLLLGRLARWGGGEMDFTLDIRRVPAVVLDRVKWALDKARPPEAEQEPDQEPERPVDPPKSPNDRPVDPDTETPPPATPVPLRLIGAHPVITAIDRDAMPVVADIRPVEPRGRAVTLMQGDGAEPRPPVLLVHHAGAGRAMLLALDLGAEAGGELGRWPALPGLLAQAVRFLGPPPPPPAVITTDVQYGPTPAEPQGLVFAHVTWRVDGGPPGAALELVAGRREGEAEPDPIRVQRTGPRRWEARLPAPPPGDLVQLAAAVSLEGEELARGRHAAIRPPAPESVERSDAAAARSLATESGGVLAPAPSELPPLLPVPTSQESLAWWCWLVAVVLFVPVAIGVRQV